jgi:hypothetical protein
VRRSGCSACWRLARSRIDARSLSPDDGRLARTFEADDDIAGFLPGLDVPVSLGDLIQRIRSVDDRPELSGLDQLPEVLHHQLVMLRNGEQDLLAAMQRGNERTERILGQRAHSDEM